MNCDKVEEYKNSYFSYAQYTNIATRGLLDKAKKLVNSHIEKCENCKKNGVKKIE